MRKAAGALGRLLERRFAEMGPDGVDVEVVAPVRLAIAVQHAELAEASEEGFDGGRESALYERFRAAVEQAVARAVTAFPTSTAPEPHRVARPDSRPAETLPTPLEKLLKLLTAWWRRGELEHVLCAVGDRTVEAWHRTILPIERGRPVGGGFDLRLMSSVNDVNVIPTEGKNLIIVAAVNNVLHFRIFDGDGKEVVDTDENRLKEEKPQIGQQIEGSGSDSRACGLPTSLLATTRSGSSPLLHQSSVTPLAARSPRQSKPRWRRGGSRVNECQIV